MKYPGLSELPLDRRDLLMTDGPQCQVERCRFPATARHTLKERNGAFDFPKEVLVCEVHREQLSDPATEWVLLNDRERRRLL